MSLREGSLFASRYRVLRCLKSGGMGAVYEVLDERTDARRALKTMHADLEDDPDLRARFEQEAKITGRIESENVVRTFDAGVDEGGIPFLVMELLSGQDLHGVLKKEGPRPVEEVIHHLTAVARALDRTHAAGVIHRDLKPENLFLTTRDDQTTQVKILDFGVAKLLQRATQAQNTRAVGTPAYMAPEQILGLREIGPAADRYALAHIAYTLVVGEPYWQEETKTLETLPLFSSVAQGAIEPPTRRAHRRKGRSLPAAFDAWFFQATTPAPANRFPTSIALLQAFAAAFGAYPGVGAPSVRQPGAPMTGTPSGVGPTSPPTMSPHTMPGFTGPPSVPGNLGPHSSPGLPPLHTPAGQWPSQVTHAPVTASGAPRGAPDRRVWYGVGVGVGLLAAALGVGAAVYASRGAGPVAAATSPALPSEATPGTAVAVAPAPTVSAEPEVAPTVSAEVPSAIAVRPAVGAPKSTGTSPPKVVPPKRSIW